jgi:hypothetical protein
MDTDQARARLAALFNAPSASESQPTTQPTNKFSTWQPEARMRAYTLLLTLERISGDDSALSKFGQLAEHASQSMLTLLAALQCGH